MNTPRDPSSPSLADTQPASPAASEHSSHFAAPAPAAASNKRRRALALGGVAALAVGGGIAWRARHESSMGGAAHAAGGVDTTVWSLAFDRPEGGQLRFADLRGRPLVLNFWATWCPPCVEEMPELDRFQRAWSDRGWQVVGLAVDNPTAVRRFLEKQPVSFAIGLAGLDGSTLARTLGNAQGGLPYTVVMAANGAIRQRKAGQTSLDELNRWAQSI